MRRVDLQLIGGGNMGEALVGGLVESGTDPATLRIVETLEARADELRATFPDVEVASSPGPAAGSILAVKPHHVIGAATEVARAADSTGVGRVLSIAAGVTVAAVEAALPRGTAVVRAMPNTPALVGAGASAIAPGTVADDHDLLWAESILGAVGVVARVPEPLLDAVTGLSGSGPAYVFLVIESLVEGGVAAGLPRDVATQLAGQTVAGAARLFVESGNTAADLRAGVTSPGGTTAAGLLALERAAVRAALIDAVAAATDRSRELGR